MPFFMAGCRRLYILATVIAFDDPAFSQDRLAITEQQHIGLAVHSFGQDTAGTEIAVTGMIEMVHRKIKGPTGPFIAAALLLAVARM